MNASLETRTLHPITGVPHHTLPGLFTTLKRHNNPSITLLTPNYGHLHRASRSFLLVQRRTEIHGETPSSDHI
ncbi:Hypothetical predicted protein [Pelobates cultripes]|uniref:Uncharacterized protein n=1 Tax=Pelobates cultripes TaxID=61616 RepID=A0AAD1VXA0_PELCU|nr:Hypothetical predicted protein [Pelobates cultripes]